MAQKRTVTKKTVSKNTKSKTEKPKPSKPSISASSIKVKKLKDGAIIPVKAHNSDAGLDLFTLEGFEIQKQQRKLVSTGIAVQIPKGHVGLIKEKSGLASRGIEIKAGVIDEGYTGELSVIMVYPEGFTYDSEDNRLKRNAKMIFEAGDKIAQLVVLPVSSAKIIEVSELDDSDRGSDGFGSSGA